MAGEMVEGDGRDGFLGASSTLAELQEEVRDNDQAAASAESSASDPVSFIESAQVPDDDADDDPVEAWWLNFYQHIDGLLTETNAADVGAALVHFYRHLGDNGYADQLDSLLRDGKDTLSKVRGHVQEELDKF